MELRRHGSHHVLDIVVPQNGVLAGVADDVAKVGVIEVGVGMHEHEVAEVAEDAVAHLQSPHHLREKKLQGGQSGQRVAL